MSEYVEVFGRYKRCKMQDLELMDDACLVEMNVVGLDRQRLSNARKALYKP